MVHQVFVTLDQHSRFNRIPIHLRPDLIQDTVDIIHEAQSSDCILIGANFIISTSIHICLKLHPPFLFHNDPLYKDEKCLCKCGWMWLGGVGGWIKVK